MSLPGNLPTNHQIGDTGWVADENAQSTAVNEDTAVLAKMVATLYSGPTTPSPTSGSGEYIWFETDGNGTVLDILSGKA